MTPIITVVYAVDKDGGIGYQGKLPWQGELPGELKLFKELTMGHPLIMGRKTHESIGRPLPGRHNIVLSRQSGFQANGCTVVGSLEEALRFTTEEMEVFVIGGAAVYQAALPLAARLHRTEVSGDFDTDTFFPPVNQDEWRVVRQELKPEWLAERHPFTVVVEERVR